MDTDTAISATQSGTDSEQPSNGTECQAGTRTTFDVAQKLRDFLKNSTQLNSEQHFTFSVVDSSSCLLVEKYKIMKTRMDRKSDIHLTTTGINIRSRALYPNRERQTGFG
jgi:hypothetical protein